MRQATQLAMKLNTWGGHRKGAGRPNLKGEGAHASRKEFDPRHPSHVTIRVKKGVPGLRSSEVLAMVQLAADRARAKCLRITDFAVLGNHIHMIVEAPNKAVVSRGMQAFNISLAQSLRWSMRKHGLPVTKGILEKRYHMHVLKGPREAKTALRYVLTNESKHRKGPLRVDSYSSAPLFKEWKRLVGGVPQWGPNSKDWEERWFARLQKITSPPRSWLLRAGWMKV
jgi:putative transposase